MENESIFGKRFLGINMQLSLPLKNGIIIELLPLKNGIIKKI